MAQRDYFRHVYKINKITGTTQTIATLHPGGGFEQHVEDVTMLNETSNGADLLIGENSGDGFILLDIIESLAKNTLGRGSSKELVIKNDQKLELRIRDATALDVITVVVSGYNWRSGEAGL